MRKLKRASAYSRALKKTLACFLNSHKTNARVVKSCVSVSQTAVIYFLDLKKISLISSLKSVITTAITAMKKLRSSIMDSYMIRYFHPHAQLNNQKKSPTPKNWAYTSYHTGFAKPFSPSTKWIKYYNIKKDTNV